MSQIFPLDRVIRRVDSLKPQKAGQISLIIDANKKKILSKDPFLKMGRNIHYFLVSTENTAECEGPTCRVKDASTRNSININISLSEISCEPGCEEKVALALFEGKHPGATLNGLLERWVLNFVRDKKKSGIDFVLNYFEIRSELEEYLKEKSLEKIGLNLEVILSLDNEHKLGPYSIKSSFFAVRVRDFKDELNLRFATELHVNYDKKIYAILNYHRLQGLETTIKNQIQKFLLENVTLHEFCYELNTGLRDRLIEKLDKALLDKGRRVAFLSIESSTISSLPQETIKLEHDVKCNIKAYHEPIIVMHRLLLNLENVGRFKASKVSDLVLWAKSKLDKITQSVLFDKNYVDLVIDFDEDEIKNPMENEAKLIGYNVKQLMAIPNLEPIKLKNGFDFKLDGGFETHDSRVEVKLSIVVNGIIHDLKKLRKYINPQTNIIDEMKETVQREAALLLHEIDPERFYMRFYFADIKRERVSVEEELKKRIIKSLKEEFYADDIHVIPKILETDLTERFQQLQEESPYFFNIEVFPLPDGGQRELVSFRIGFEVLNVHQEGWFIFQSKKFESKEEHIKKIIEVLEEDLKANLETIPNRYLKYDNIQGKYDIEKNMLDSATLRVIRTFGLLVKISLRRLPTKAEQAEQKKVSEYIRSLGEADIEATDMTVQAHLRELKGLYKKQEELIAAGIEEDDPELETVVARIQKITQKISSYSIEREGGENLKQLTSITSEKKFSFDDYKKIALPVQAQPKQIEEKGKKTGETEAGENKE